MKDFVDKSFSSIFLNSLFEKKVTATTQMVGDTF